VQSSVKKLKVLEDKVDNLIKLKRTGDAIDVCKKLYHLSTSFAVVMLLNENYELFDEQLMTSLRSWEMLMKLHPNNSFNVNYKK